MAEKQQQGKTIIFKSVHLLKDHTLGIGSYGKVCKAKCDDLLCAAKIIHETLFDPTAQQPITSQREHRLPMRRFEQECEFLSTIRHPNIIQYLGIYQDPDTGLPALLMELMDDSLTHFLESSPQPIPYHIQVNICHDVTLALSFLHSNSIVHRDLSSNNVLLIGNVRAKVTDFGMARLGDQNPRATQLTFTMCPGSDVYMPPEAVQDKPEYTDKIDCFSFGVITLQILTREFPKPGDRRKRIEIDHPGLPKGTLIEARISEVERRQNHIGKIDPNHTLLPIAFDCLKDEDVERPSAQQLCERVAALKEDPQYSESVRAVETRSTAEQGRSEERDRELRSLRQQHSQQVQGLQQIIQSQTRRLDEKEQVLRQKEQTVAAGEQQLRQQLNDNHQLMRERNQVIEEKRILERQLRDKDETIEDGHQQLKQLEIEKNEAIERLERQMGRLNQQVEEGERVIAQFQTQIAEVEPELRSATDMIPKSKEQSSSEVSIKLTWREGEKAPCSLVFSHCAAAMCSSTVYVRVLYQVYAYAISTCSWSQLPDCPTNCCPVVVINNLLTLVGGTKSISLMHITNQLFSLIGEGSSKLKWTERFSRMPTKRGGTIALCTGTALIVAGGMTKDYPHLITVEVMNTITKQWSTAADLPQPPLYFYTPAPAAVCGDHIYILGKSSMYTCSVLTLIQSCISSRKRDTGVWKEVAAPPVTSTTSVSINGRLLVVGGTGSNEKTTAAVHMYNPSTDSWEVISHMGTPRWNCIAAVLPSSQLMVMGGITMTNFETDSVELATIDQ